MKFILMKRTTLAIAMLSAFAASASAQSSVTLYGIVDTGIAYEDNGSTTVTRMDAGNMNGNRWGLKGSEDLGGGLKAIFNLESGFTLDDGAPADSKKLFNRLSWVGVKSGFGTVKLGRQKSPVYATKATWDSFNGTLAGRSSNLFDYNGSRTDNMVSYNYAASGFYGELQYALGEVAGSNSITGENSAGRSAGLFVGYKAGPFDVVLTHQNIHNGTATASYDTAEKMTLLGGNYDFGMVKLFAAYAQEKSVGAVPKDQKDAHLGLTAPVGTAGTVRLSYLRKTDDLIANADAQQVAIGYVHALSKRTFLYTSYAQVSNDSRAA